MHLKQIIILQTPQTPPDRIVARLILEPHLVHTAGIDSVISLGAICLYLLTLIFWK